MTKLVLVRHGESEWNKLNLFTGWTDVELSDKGRSEAAAAGQLLKKEGYDFDICYTSYLKRAIHTLNGILCEMDREWLPVIKTWKLNERHYGDLQGKNKAEAAEKFGSQCVVVAIDARRRRVGKAADPSLSYSESIKINDEWTPEDGWTVYKNGGRIDMNIDAVEWAVRAVELGAGEILLTSMDADGTKAGYDIELTRTIAEKVNVPVIASGGAGTCEHFAEALTDGKAEAALAASLFHFKELEIMEVKKYLKDKGIPVRM